MKGKFEEFLLDSFLNFFLVVICLAILLTAWVVSILPTYGITLLIPPILLLWAYSHWKNEPKD